MHRCERARTTSSLRAGRHALRADAPLAHAGCKHTVALLQEELSPTSTERASKFAMMHVCYRAVWVYRPTVRAAPLSVSRSRRPARAHNLCIAS